jgi:hypothetical protein
MSNAAASWQGFVDLLVEENARLAELGTAALAMTDALVSGSPADLEATDRKLERARILYVQANERRAKLMAQGFGKLTLQQVCAYAPGPLRRTVYHTLHEMRTRGIALRITVGNNKSLIRAGLKRLENTIGVLQKCLTEQPGTYKRRGNVPLASGSVLVSRRA